MQLDIDVLIVVQDLGEHLVNRVVFLGLHGLAQLILRLGNLILAVEAAANRALLKLSVLMLVHPVLLGAQPAEELSALLTVVTNILKVEF